jgi:hypothetical protein
MHKMIFSCFAAGEADIARAMLLAESIRTFAGEYSDLPFLLVHLLETGQFTDMQQEKIQRFDIHTHPVELTEDIASFPFAGKVIASASAEEFSEGKSSQLVWMDTGSLVVNPLELLLLKEGIRIGYRPVDHLLIGSPYEEPPDDFWKFIYQSCGVSSESVYSMLTSTDQVIMRPYINAGMLVVRPEEKLLECWRDTFLDVYQTPRAIKFYEDNYLYRIFIHQAVLAGCFIAGYPAYDAVQLPPGVNYPLHMHTRYPSHLKPTSMNDLVSFRYEDYFSTPGWEQILPVDPPLKDWLAEREVILSAR